MLCPRLYRKQVVSLRCELRLSGSRNCELDGYTTHHRWDLNVVLPNIHLVTVLSKIKKGSTSKNTPRKGNSNLSLPTRFSWLKRKWVKFSSHSLCFHQHPEFTLVKDYITSWWESNSPGFGVSNFFCTGQDSKQILRLCRSYGICCSCSTLPLQFGSSHRGYGTVSVAVSHINFVYKCRLWALLTCGLKFDDPS